MVIRVQDSVTYSSVNTNKTLTNNKSTIESRFVIVAEMYLQKATDHSKDRIDTTRILWRAQKPITLKFLSRVSTLPTLKFTVYDWMLQAI